MIIDLVRYFGAVDSADARDSVFRFRKPSRFCVGGVGCEDCRVNASGDGRGSGLSLESGGVMTAAARAAAEDLARCSVPYPFLFDLGGVLYGLNCTSSPSAAASNCSSWFSS
jgi:hypothetical protein